MSKFAIGNEVENAADDHEVGTVVAVFPTDDGKFRYAVDTEGYGALQFFNRGKTSRSPLLGRLWHIALCATPIRCSSHFGLKFARDSIEAVGNDRGHVLNWGTCHGHRKSAAQQARPRCAASCCRQRCASATSG